MSTTEVALTGAGDASGRATLSITPYRRQVWTVSQVSIQAPTAPAEAIAEAYKGSFLITPLVAQSDAATGDPPVTLRPGETLAVRWQNLSPGDVVRALFIYDDGND